MDKLYTEFESFIKAEKLFRPGQRLLVAVSGGVDSVVLARLCRSAGYEIEIAHANFQLRGQESFRDEEYTAQFAEIINVPFHVKRFDTAEYARHHKLSIQEAARSLRYQWFSDLAKERKLDRILTAHHADDNVETMMMNLFKGTGIAGLRGILPLAGNIARPLLFASRTDIERYATEHGIGYVEDSSNTSDKYSRNYFRLNVIPLVEKLLPGAVDRMKKNLSRFREVETLYQDAIKTRINGLVMYKGEEIHIPVEKLRFTTPLTTVIYELLSPFGFSAAQVAEAIQLMDSDTGKYIRSATHQLLKNRNWFVLAPISQNSKSVLVVESDTELIQFTGGSISLSLQMKAAGFQPDPNPLVAQLDADSLQFPLLIRSWKEGDYFYPLGLQKKKKIARFLIDRKLSKIEKEKIMVVLSGDQLVWVVGQRIDHRVRIKPSTKRVYVMKVQFSD